ncbi:hypothetical protein [Fulvivirga sp.]|uniref:hypothetical protein n=1 Tax=Fulvivirga sp. TaxID=1931237 RepID=UPI0032EF928E
MKKYWYIIFSLLGLLFIYAIYKSESSRLKEISKYDSLKEEDWKGKEYYPSYELKKEPILSEDEEKDNYESNQNKLFAYNGAIEVIKERLISPSTAKFPSLQDRLKQITYIGKGKYSIDSWVDSQNSYGAIIRSRFSCVIEITEESMNLVEVYIE